MGKEHEGSNTETECNHPLDEPLGSFARSVSTDKQKEVSKTSIYNRYFNLLKKHGESIVETAEHEDKRVFYTTVSCLLFSREFEKQPLDVQLTVTSARTRKSLDYEMAARKSNIIQGTEIRLSLDIFHGNDRLGLFPLQRVVFAITPTHIDRTDAQRIFADPSVGREDKRRRSATEWDKSDLSKLATFFEGQ